MPRLRDESPTVAAPLEMPLTFDGELDLFGAPDPKPAPGARAAEREAGRRERREAKADRVAGWAESREAEATARLSRAREMGDAIPFGQPMMTDHYSYGRDRNYRERMRGNYDKGFEAQQAADRHARRAEGIRRWEEERLTAPVTLRRIKTLEADQRRVARALEGRPEYVDGKIGLRPPDDDYAAKLRVQAADLDDEITYWRAHVSELEASGVKVWAPADFKKGDRVVGSSWVGTVVRVNPKSVSVRLPEGTFMGGSVKAVPYDKVKVNAGPGEIGLGANRRPVLT